MDYSPEVFKKDLLNLEIKEIYHKYLLGNSIWYFEEYLKHENPSWAYDSFKTYIAEKFSLPFNNVAIIGSAKLGFSPSPDKNLSPYRIEKTNEQKASDIDLILVSKYHFEKFWEAYTDKCYNEDYIHEYAYMTSCLFKRFICLKGFTTDDKIYNEWQQKTAGYQKELQEKFRIRHNVNYRIFESWEAAERYYIHGLSKIKDKIRSNNYA